MCVEPCTQTTMRAFNLITFEQKETDHINQMIRNDNIYHYNFNHDNITHDNINHDGINHDNINSDHIKQL
jgi:hypothetical protein